MPITQNKNENNLLSKNYYKFENNLLKLSINTSIDGALIEWNEIYKEKRDEKSGLCICQHKIGRSSAGMALPSPKYLFYV